MVKGISILGSTGSIGVNTLKVIRHLGKEVRVDALAAHSNIDLLEQQAKEFNPSLLAVYDLAKAEQLRKRLPQIEVLSGMAGLKAAAELSHTSFVVSAISGTLGLEPTLAAIEARKDIGLANKEALVSGGALVMQRAKSKGVKILPIDSEHSAIFQCLNHENPKSIKRLILTASGGPFRAYSDEELASVNLESALNHPTWQMGPKVTVDSSTLMNKGLEVIEAHWLFNIPLDQIEVVVHPQSIIHSMVEFIDGSMMAQLSAPSMIVPIQYALTYPERRLGIHPPFDFTKGHHLEFSPPDMRKFRCLQLARDAISVGKSMPCYMNAANEVLVHGFLENKISWKEIALKLEDLMQGHDAQHLESVDDIVHIDQLARQEAELSIHGVLSRA